MLRTFHTPDLDFLKQASWLAWSILQNKQFSQAKRLFGKSPSLEYELGF